MLANGRRLAQVDALKVEPAAFELLGWANHVAFLAAKSSDAYPSAPQIRILRVGV